MSQKRKQSLLLTALVVLALPTGFWLLSRLAGMAALWPAEKAWVDAGGAPVAKITAASVASPTTRQIEDMLELMRIWPALTDSQMWAVGSPEGANLYMLQDALATFEPVVQWAAPRAEDLWLTFSVTSDRQETESFDPRLLGQAEADRRTLLWREISEALPGTGMEGFVSPSRQIGRMLRAKAVYAARRGDTPAAAEALSLAIRQGHKARQQAGLADAWQYGDDLAKALMVMEAIWKDGGEGLDMIEPALAQEDLLALYSAAQRFEASSRLYLLSASSQRDALDSGVLPIWRWLSFHFAYAVRQRDMARMLDAYNLLLSGLGDPVLRQEAAIPGLTGGWSVNWEDMAYFGDAKSLRCLGDAEARRRIALAAISLRKQREAGLDAKYPATPSLPSDPLAGQPFDYQSDGKSFTFKSLSSGCGGREVTWNWN